jgi:DNA-binding XRE family transcriptional regulator
MKLHKWRDIRAARFTPEQIEKMERGAAAELLEMDLRELRELVGITQAELAEKMDLNQATVSKLERDQIETRVATLKRAVEALGGELELTAVIKGQRVRLAVG